MRVIKIPISKRNCEQLKGENLFEAPILGALQDSHCRSFLLTLTRTGWRDRPGCLSLCSHLHSQRAGPDILVTLSLALKGVFRTPSFLFFILIRIFFNIHTYPPTPPPLFQNGSILLYIVKQALLVFVHLTICSEDFPGGACDEPTYQCRIPEFDPWVQKRPRRSEWQPTPVSCLENSMDRGAWWATVRGVTKSWTPLSS